MLRYARAPTLLFYGLLFYALHQSPLDGTWELARIFRSGPAPATRVVAIDSTVYVRVSLESHPGDWISGTLYRRYFGEPERSKVEAGPLRGTGRFIIGAELDHPTWQRVRTVAWAVGARGGRGADTLRLGTPFVPGADSIELKRVRPDARYPATVVEVVTVP